MNGPLVDLKEKHLQQRDSARAERDFALVERDSARTERDNFKGQADNMKKNNAAQEQFVATVSHDLRNPIGAIKMAIDLIRDGSTNGQLTELTDLIDRSADQAAELINQLLDAHLIKSGAKLPITVIECDLWEILHKCHQSLAPDDQASLLLNFTPGKELWGQWDPYTLERAIKNLISNAIKFSDQSRQIEISAWQTEEITTLTVQNFGEVISLKNQLRIFDSQFRVNNPEATSKKGWGLGLTLVRGIAEAHSGKIEVTSSVSEGTVFTLILPNGPPVIKS